MQFVGFPRSGHTLIGAILDAHREAVIAHELDVMGLIDAGVSRHWLYRLILANADRFAAAGRHWNGFCYAVPGQADTTDLPPRIIGDKKGDWVARRLLAKPELVETLQARVRDRAKWILVTRHPLDNIATMSLRKGGHYDRLRIECPGAAFAPALRAAQFDGRIAQTVRDDMIADYRSLCDGVAVLKRQIDPSDWHEVQYEQVVAEPAQQIAALLRFVGLAEEADFVRRAASIVRDGKTPSREKIAWRDEQRAAVAELIETFDFLNP